jgi:hypothetical protein
MKCERKENLQDGEEWTGIHDPRIESHERLEV